MRIDGEDYSFHRLVSQISIEKLIQFVGEKWGDAIVSDKNGKICLIENSDCFALFSGKEFVIYKNRQAVLDWEKQGWSLENSLAAILVIIEQDGLYLTCGPIDFMPDIETVLE